MSPMTRLRIARKGDGGETNIQIPDDNRSQTGVCACSPLMQRGAATKGDAKLKAVAEAALARFHFIAFEMEEHA